MTLSLLFPVHKSLVALGNFANINAIRAVRIHNTAIQYNAIDKTNCISKLVECPH